MQSGTFQDAASLVKGAIRLSEYVARHTDEPLKGTPGRSSFRTSCIVHGGDNPNGMSIDDQLGLWHCFTDDCGGGSIIDLYMKMNGVTDFGDAVRGLAEEVGVQLPQRENAGPGKARILKALRLVSEAATEYLIKGQTRDASTTRRYLKSREAGTRGFVTRWGLGLLPPGRDAVSFVLDAAEGDEQALIAADVLGIGSGDFKTRFVRMNGRLLFPIMNAKGEVIAFGARIVPGVEHSGGDSKYINSTKTLVYDKSETLYGMHLLGEGTKQVAIVEGYFGAMAINEASGDEELVAVASCGTAVSSSHMQLVRSVPNISLVFDGDAAGRKALLRSVWLTNVVRSPMEAVILDEGMDPWDVYLDHGPDHVLDLLDRGTSLIHTAINLQTEELGKSPDQFDGWVRDTAAALSHQSDRDSLIAAAARAMGQSPPAYKRGLAMPVSLDAARAVSRTGSSGILLTPATSTLVTAILGMDPLDREGILATFRPWTPRTEEFTRNWLPVMTDSDMKVFRRLVLGMDDVDTEAEVDHAIARLMPNDDPADLGVIVRGLLHATNHALSSISDGRTTALSRLLPVLRRAMQASRIPGYQAGCFASVLDLALEAERLTIRAVATASASA